MDSETQESRTEKIAVAVTPREKLAIQLVAGVKGTDVSNLLRDRAIPALIIEADEIRSSLASAA